MSKASWSVVPNHQTDLLGSKQFSKAAHLKCEEATIHLFHHSAIILEISLFIISIKSSQGYVTSFCIVPKCLVEFQDIAMFVKNLMFSHLTFLQSFRW